MAKKGLILRMLGNFGFFISEIKRNHLLIIRPVPSFPDKVKGKALQKAVSLKGFRAMLRVY